MTQEVLKEYGPKGVEALEKYAPNKTGSTDRSCHFKVEKNTLILSAGGYYNRRFRRLNGPNSQHTDTYSEALTEFVEELTKAVKADFVNSMEQEVLSVWH